jgi:hypothetical protein
MFWWTTFHSLQVISYLFIVGVGSFWLVTDFWPTYIQPRLKGARQGGKLRATGQTIHTTEAEPVFNRFSTGPTSSAETDEPHPGVSQGVLETITVDKAKAGQTISSVPNYNPSKSGAWNQDRTVVGTAFAHIYTPQGMQDCNFIWLSGDLLIMKTPRKWFLLSELPLSSNECQLLLDEREALLNDVKAGDSTPDIHIDKFRGCGWRINGAYGRNEGANAGQSTIEYTSVLTNPGEFADDIPNLALQRGRPVSYYDLRADFETGDPAYAGNRFVAIWAEEGSDCVGYVGKEMTQEEVHMMGVV